VFEEEYQSTVGAGYVAHRATCGKQEVELQNWDTAGMERYRSLGPIYYRDAVAAIIVYDQSDQASADSLSKWLAAFRGTVRGSAYIAIVGNKDDLETKTVAPEPIRQWAIENGFQFFLTSAKTGKNVNELFQSVIEHLVQSSTVEVSPAKAPQALQATANPGRPLQGCCW
jgi:small GTP-binding protein